MPKSLGGLIQSKVTPLTFLTKIDIWVSCKGDGKGNDKGNDKKIINDDGMIKSWESQGLEYKGNGTILV